MNSIFSNWDGSAMMRSLAAQIYLISQEPKPPLVYRDTGVEGPGPPEILG